MAATLGGATATRALPAPSGEVLPARVVHDAALAALADLVAIVVRGEGEIPD